MTLQTMRFGILVTEAVERTSPELLQVDFDTKRRQAIISRYEVTEYIYTLNSHVRRDLTIFIERRDPNQGEYYAMPELALTTLGHTRWPVVVPANAEASFTIRIRNIYKNFEDVNNWQLTFIEALQTAGLLTGNHYARLRQLYIEKQESREAADQIKLLQTEYDQLAPRQEQLRKNLDTLGQSDREVEIRNRILDDLESSENRRRELEQQMVDLKTQIGQHQQQQQTLLDEIFSEA